MQVAVDLELVASQFLSAHYRMCRIIREPSSEPGENEEKEEKEMEKKRERKRGNPVLKTYLRKLMGRHQPG
jgi:hypothetical protein